MLVASVSTDRLSVRSTDRLILDLIYLKIIDVGRWAPLHTKFLCRIKRSYIRPSPAFPYRYMLHKDLVPEISHDLILILTLGIAPGPRSYFVSRLKSHFFNYQKSILLLLFFLKCARPNKVDRAVGLGHFEFKLQLHKNPPLQRSYYKNENSFFGEWPILQAPASKEPSRGHQGQVSSIATRRWLTAGNDPQGPWSLTRGRVGTAMA